MAGRNIDVVPKETAQLFMCTPLVCPIAIMQRNIKLNKLRSSYFNLDPYVE